jgi:hypothetical protein
VFSFNPEYAYLPEADRQAYLWRVVTEDVVDERFKQRDEFASGPKMPSPPGWRDRVAGGS